MHSDVSRQTYHDVLAACLPDTLSPSLHFHRPAPKACHFASSPAYKTLITASHSHSPFPQTTQQPIQPKPQYPHTYTQPNLNQPQPNPTCQPGPSAKNSPTSSPPWKPPASSLTSKYVVRRPPLSPQPHPLSRALSLPSPQYSTAPVNDTQNTPLPPGRTVKACQHMVSGLKKLLEDDLAAMEPPAGAGS